MPGLVPGIHVAQPRVGPTWMAGTSPATTEWWAASAICDSGIRLFRGRGSRAARPARRAAARSARAWLPRFRRLRLGRRLGLDLLEAERQGRLLLGGMHGLDRTDLALAQQPLDALDRV